MLPIYPIYILQPSLINNKNDILIFTYLIFVYFYLVQNSMDIRGISMMYFLKTITEDITRKVDMRIWNGKKHGIKMFFH